MTTLPFEEALPADAPRERWLAARSLGIGGSDASAVAGVNPWNTRFAVWLDKTGQAPEEPPTLAMRMGVLLEPVVRDLFTEETGVAVTPMGLLRSREHPFMLVTPDGFTDDGGIFEAKTTTRWLSHEWDDGQIPDHAEVQVQHALAVTGKTHAWAAGLIDGRELRVVRVERDDALIADLIVLEHQFWTDHVLANEAPGVVGGDLEYLKTRPVDVERIVVTDTEAEGVRRLLARRETAQRGVRVAEEILADVDAELRRRAGTAAEVVTEAGEVLFTVKANGTFAGTRFKAAHPDLWGELQVLRPVLDVDKLKGNHPDLYEEHRARVLRVPTKKK